MVWCVSKSKQSKSNRLAYFAGESAVNVIIGTTGFYSPQRLKSAGKLIKVVHFLQAHHIWLVVNNLC